MKQTKESEIIEDWIIEENCKLKDRNVLEIGCGAGKYTFRVAKFVKKITGIEPPPEIVGTYKLPEIPPNWKGKIEFKESFSNKLDFFDKSFDTVFGAFAFHEIPHNVQMETLKEAYRVLKKDGKLVLLDPTPESFLHNFVRIIKPGEEHGIRVQKSNENIQKSINDGLFVKEKYLTYTKDYIFEGIKALHTEIIDNWARMNKPKTKEERKEWAKKIDDVIGYKKGQRPIIITELVQLFVLRKK